MAEQKWITSAPGNVPPDFTVHQLRVFRTVAQHLSYTRAAETLYLSQPAVAQQVKSLEQMLGLRLFARSGRGIMLTPAGQEYLTWSIDSSLVTLKRLRSCTRFIHSSVGAC